MNASPFSPPTTLLFDVMSTVVEDPFHEHLPRFFAMSLRELLDAKDPSAWAEFERDELGEAEFLARFFADRRDYDHEGLKRSLFEHYRWLDGMRELLVELREGGRELHWVSNYPLWYREIEARLGLSELGSWTFVSCHEGVRKPDPEVYRRCLERTGAPARACVFVDDQEANCTAAAAAGMHSVHMKDARQLRAELRSLGISLTEG